jgi:hypothetical protein
LTYFETTGPRGIVDGGPYPVHDVFVTLGEWSLGALVELHVSDELSVAGLACVVAGKTVLALANLTDGPSEVEVRRVGGLAPVHRLLQPYEVSRVD